jgi:hypothetical protein
MHENLRHQLYPARSGALKTRNQKARIAGGHSHWNDLSTHGTDVYDLTLALKHWQRNGEIGERTMTEAEIRPCEKLQTAKKSCAAEKSRNEIGREIPGEVSRHGRQPS